MFFTSLTFFYTVRQTLPFIHLCILQLLNFPKPTYRPILAWFACLRSFQTIYGRYRNILPDEGCFMYSSLQQS